MTREDWIVICFAVGWIAFGTGMAWFRDVCERRWPHLADDY